MNLMKSMNFNHLTVEIQLDQANILAQMKERDDQIRPSESDYLQIKTLHDQIIQGIMKVQQTTGQDDFQTSDNMNSSEVFQILEFHTIGSFTRNCILKQNLRVDIALIIDTLPTHETVGQVSRQILAKMKEAGNYQDGLLLNSADYGFDIMIGDKTVAVWLTIPFERLPELCPGF